MIWSQSLLHENVVESARRDPHGCAFKLGDEELTFRELDQQSNKLARCLLSLGVQAGDRIGILQYKTLESAVSLYGILKSGCAFVPIDPNSPEDRFGAILDDCDIRILITQSDRQGFLERFVQNDSRLEWVIGCEVDVDVSRNLHAPRFKLWGEVEALPGEDVAVNDLTSDSLAYIMFTSGSTGSPKGMMHTHASGQAHVDLCVKVYELSSSDRLANHAPLHFDIATMGYLAIPRVGGCTVFIPESHTLFPASMGEMVEQESITIWYSVPFALIQLLQRGALDHRDLSSLRLVLFGGEPISCKHLRKLLDLVSGAKFCNLYGPAETNNCTSYFLPPDLNGGESEIPIGKPLEGVHIQIDSVDEPSPDNPAVGELWVKSPTMMKGYWGKPELNARVFKEFDGPGNSSGTYYNTGDLVSYRQDGELMFHGRKDRLIKIRGNRIELDEIEAVVCQYPSIVECAAFVVDRHQDQERVESCIRTEQNVTVDIPDLLKFISGKLPRYAIPNRITQVESYPRTTSGKIDRVALQAAAESGYTEYRSI